MGLYLVRYKGPHRVPHRVAMPEKVSIAIGCTPECARQAVGIYDDPPASQPGLRSLGPGANQAAPGNLGPGIRPVTTAQRLALTPTLWQCVIDTDMSRILSWNGFQWVEV